MDKTSFVRKMFEDIAFSYDLQNSVLSLGRDIAWRKVLARSFVPACSGLILDAATGTSEVAMEICRQDETAHVVGIDISPNMLGIAREKVRTRHMENRVDLGLGDGRSLPFKDDTFHGISMAFGLRNIDERKQVLAEFERVLKPGGQLLIMEFGYPEDPLLRMIYGFYFHYVLPPLGNRLSRTDYAYSYLVESVESFPPKDAFMKEIEEAGFSELGIRKLTFGIALIYSGVKRKKVL
ncbi:MAG: bifunctional demethylmenaquinone methyltransferase/2-methoxy-6-polyprenyl-1,4-benzoquinol methylase UbiE [Desulfobacteraceae bacterium]|nr:MAG: bifunctional demethylmenaquinone methyltransferase/2-methoxy-6-polyprenyl-1,4-benzoquinol methylase UbiE [Desulfobacteraceae bacterium]